MKKAQTISMDFILTFVVYVFALSIFFFTVGQSIDEDSGLDVSAELVFERLENTEFLEGSRLDAQALDSYDGFEELFVGLEKRDMDYCIYVENSQGQILRNIASSPGERSIIISENFGTHLCGTNPGVEYPNQDNYYPRCPGPESIVVTRPVLFEGDIVKLKVLACSR